MSKHRYYRIGDFARKLGVTPDLLKYCEQKQLISSVKQENGYRYYSFDQAATVYEYLKLKNQGFSAVEIFSILHGTSFRELSTHSVAREEELKQQLNFTQALLRYSRKLADADEMFTKSPAWQLTRRGPWVFLPHSDEDLLTEDEACLNRVSQWIRWMPVVFSASRIKPDGPRIWGLAAEEEFARQQGLDLSAPVQHIPAGLYLQLYMTEDLPRTGQELNRAGAATPERLGLRQAGPSIQFVLAKMWGEAGRKGYSVLCIPVEEAAQ